MSEEMFIAFKGRHLVVSELLMTHLCYTFPHVGILAELRFMDNWLEANPRRRKRNMERFIGNWLKQEERKAINRQIEACVGAGPSDYAREPIKVKKKA